MKNYRLKDYRFRLIAYVVALSIIGIFAIGSAKASVQSKQIMGLCVGLVGMVVASVLDYQLILKLRRIWYVLMVLLLGLVLAVGKEVSGATRWIEVGGFQFQPSELCKIMLIVCLAAFFMRHQAKLNTIRMLFASFVLVAIPLGLIVKEPDLSTTIVVTLMFLTMLYVAGLSYKIILPTLLVAIPAAVVSLVLMFREKFPFLETYQYSRILAWKYPELYTDSARQQQNSIIAIGSGQLWGKGLNNSSITSLKNGNYLSEPQTAFIFTIIGEELGFVGCMAVLILMMLIVFECILIAKNARDLGGRLLCMGMASLISFQSLINIGVTTGLLPNTGIPQPFVSYGLTSLIRLLLGIGMVLNVGLQSGRNNASEYASIEETIL